MAEKFNVDPEKDAPQESASQSTRQLFRKYVVELAGGDDLQPRECRRIYQNKNGDSLVIGIDSLGGDAVEYYVELDTKKSSYSFVLQPDGRLRLSKADDEIGELPTTGIDRQEEPQSHDPSKPLHPDFAKPSTGDDGWDSVELARSFDEVIDSLHWATEDEARAIISLLEILSEDRD